MFKAKSLTTIMSKLVVCPYKFGFTGTLDDSNTHKLVLEGLFGPVESVIKTAELIKQKYLAVHGGVPGQARDEIRSIVESEDRALIVASYGTFSTGVNIKRLNNVVFASPSKSKIRVLQSIGRGLRRSDSKVGVRLYDIVDDLRKGSWVNFTARHYRERVKIYNDEQFPYKIHTYKLKQEKQ